MTTTATRKASRAAKAADWYANQEFSHICWTCKALYSCKNAELIAGPVQATHICPACAAKQNLAQPCSICQVALDAHNTHPVSDDGTGYCVECAERKMVQERMALFFEDVARMAKIQRAADKKAAAHAKKLASLVILGRATFKATGAQLYAVQSGEKTYHVTRIAGSVRSCVNAETGETCKARYYGNNHCCHGEVVEMLEAQRAEELATAEQVAPLVVGDAFASDLQAHVEDEMPAQDVPVVVRMEDSLNVYVITPDNRYECVRARDLDYFYPQHREATDEDIIRLNGEGGLLTQPGRKVVRQSYRDMYAADYNDVA